MAATASPETNSSGACTAIVGNSPETFMWSHSSGHVHSRGSAGIAFVARLHTEQQAAVRVDGRALPGDDVVYFGADRHGDIVTLRQLHRRARRLHTLRHHVHSGHDVGQLLAPP